MEQQQPSRDRPSNYVTREGAAWLGRLLGLIIVAMALVVSSKVAAVASQDEVWLFLSTAMTPLGIGFLILVLAQTMSRLDRR